MEKLEPLLPGGPAIVRFSFFLSICDRFLPESFALAGFPSWLAFLFLPRSVLCRPLLDP